jgi:hypothetical protein
MVVKLTRLIVGGGLLVAGLVAIHPGVSLAAARQMRTNIDVTCRCSDPVGQEFCAAFKKKVQGSVGYKLVGDTKGFGVGVHLSCVDLWHGINEQLSGRMSAISVAFTIYSSNKLPGEVYEDSSVFRVGKDAVPEMSSHVLAALGQIVGLNSKFFDQMREAANQPPAAGSQ